ncbi:adaptor protein MecA [Acetatifactor muris]|uniref:Adapter protein MecA 2 n=1 Tax=Acetatifactor muris TaxID=879566 RepID=A0A2K4ZLK8_9FIRM|nr:adaptor protein MecA [Acetatifactor muris]MCI8800299.1 adaptor protein MecA [Lachnospiraceae bacterium]MCR2049916.1 adaptor protein MecA [Acetatifactor muris]SOY31330.1 Adapter protein MecA 2 [Acetatifactor muris]
MKIEKVNENQIRCTLTREDLASRELKISELAYGTEKAKTLFRDMMRQANFEFGFEAEDIPLMIEAIPLNAECIVLIITKVEDPEELDTRFSRFSPSVTEDEGGDGVISAYGEDASTEILDLFRQMQADRNDGESGSTPENSDGAPKEHTRLFLMHSLQQVIEVSAIIAESFHGLSSLYKNGRSEGNAGKYLLLLTQGEEENSVFDRTCNIVSEYGIPQRTVPGSSAFLAEHYESLIHGNAVHALGKAAS